MNAILIENPNKNVVAVLRSLSRALGFTIKTIETDDNTLKNEIDETIKRIEAGKEKLIKVDWNKYKKGNV